MHECRSVCSPAVPFVSPETMMNDDGGGVVMMMMIIVDVTDYMSSQGLAFTKAANVGLYWVSA